MSRRHGRRGHGSWSGPTLKAHLVYKVVTSVVHDLLCFHSLCHWQSIMQTCASFAHPWLSYGMVQEEERRQKAQEQADKASAAGGKKKKSRKHRKGKKAKASKEEL